MKRWVAGAVTVLAAVGGLAAAAPASASSRAWYQTYRVNRSGTFWDVAAISKTNIWVVGDLGRKNKTTYRPFIWHYGLSGWKTVTIPGAPRFLTEQVSASAANNVWVYGLSPRGSTVVYRYDGSRWNKVPLPAQTSLGDVVVLGRKNVWAVGSSGTILSYVFHWNGSRWRGYGLGNSKVVPESISASATNNVWIAGTVSTGSVARAAAYRWNGNRWHKADMPRVRVRANDPAVTAFSHSNVWIGWDTATGFRALHWDGHHWDTMTTPSDVVANTWNVVQDGKGGYWFGPFAIRTGNTWTREPNLGVSGSLGSVVRIPGTESFLLPASVENPGSAIQRPTLYRFNF